MTDAAKKTVSSASLAKQIVEQASSLQAKASDPRSHVWVGASAGTGKTKVLTDRVLRLMLPADGHVPTDPTRILCITFTKAAAAEMATRIQNTLAKWVSLEDEVLKEKLEVLTGEKADDTLLTKARQLFAHVVDEGSRMKIMTIHGFCESVLKRFPLEAGVSPDFELIDERQSREMLQDVIDALFSYQAVQLGNDELNEAIAYLSTYLDENGFHDVMKRVVSDRSDFIKFIRSQGGLSEAVKAVYLNNKFDNTLISEGEIIKTFSQKCDWERINRVAELLLSGGKQEAGIGIDLKEAYRFRDDFVRSFHSLCSGLLTKEGAPLKKHFTKGSREKYPAELEFFEMMMDRIVDALEEVKRLRQAQATKALLIIGYVIILGYEEQKRLKSYLDFDDLIEKTSELFSGADQAAWVLYKLDGGIDHILVDEAQDTSPDQWSVIRSITQEFFSGLSRHDGEINRTLFVVGDEKQSIYSFQKADPAKFNEMKNFFSQQVASLEQELSVVPLNTSFRSTSPVLEMVDKVFSHPVYKQGVTLDEGEMIEHFVHRQGQAGRVEIWPLAIEKKEEKQGWQFPVEVIKKNRHTQILADKIASEIDLWLKNKRILPSKNRPIRPSDIMILLQKRGQLIHALLKALKARHIPVSGLDRLTVSDEIIVQDLLAVARFSLLVEDDLSLAEFLKSPFVGFDDDRLMTLALNRSGSLWEALCLQEPDIATYLKELVRLAVSSRPYEFFSFILNNSCPTSSVSGLSAAQARLGAEVLDPLNEFLAMTIKFEQLHVPHLQNFVEWFEADEEQIKREAEGSKEDLVRVMTVHGSKGLQAPIVILADAASKGRQSTQKEDNIIWQPFKTKKNERIADVKMPLWRLSKKDEDRSFKNIKEQNKTLAAEEYRRLFYVAMTRASDELIIAGSVSDVKIYEKNADLTWHKMAQEALDFDEQAFITQEDSEYWSDSKKRVYQREQSTSFEVDSVEGGVDVRYIPRKEMPNWVYELKEKEAVATKPLRPSHVDEEEPVIVSPLVRKQDHQAQEKRFLRGNILHALLQFLPEIGKEKRQLAAKNYIKQQWPDIKDSVCEDWVIEIEKVLNDERFSDVFGEGSRAEVPVSGLLKGGKDFVLSGKIDRLVVLNDRVLIVDYKTNRPSPRNVKDVPPIYLRQMAIYRQALQEIYPSHKIETALLWTDQTKLMILADTDLDQYSLAH